MSEIENLVLPASGDQQRLCTRVVNAAMAGRAVRPEDHSIQTYQSKVANTGIIPSLSSTGPSPGPAAT